MAAAPVLLLGPAWAQDGSFVARPQPGTAARRPMTQRERTNWYLRRTLGYSNTLPSLFHAGIQTWRDTPSEWEQGSEGFSQRLAARQARVAVRNTLEFGVVSLLRQDPRYERSERDGFFPRVGHALASTYFVRAEDGHRQFASGRFAGIFGSSFLATAWYPPSRSGPEYALRSAGFQVLCNMGTNVVREFWPDMKKKFLRR